MAFTIQEKKERQLRCQDMKEEEEEEKESSVKLKADTYLLRTINWF